MPPRDLLLRQRQHHPDMSVEFPRQPEEFLSPGDRSGGVMAMFQGVLIAFRRATFGLFAQQGATVFGQGLGFVQ